MLKTGLKTLLLAAVAMSAFASVASAGKLTIESWRNDDATIWKEKIIPAFQAKHPALTLVIWKALADIRRTELDRLTAKYMRRYEEGPVDASPQAPASK